jgi:prepilin-type N-terminal cleavage/methylation domain-containing protein
MARTRFVSNAAGFTIIEVIVAIAIFSIGLMAIGALQTTAMMKTGDVTRKTEAWNLLADQAERLKQLPFYVDFPPQNFSADLTVGAHAQVSPDGRYTFQWQVADDPVFGGPQNQTAMPGVGVPAGAYTVSKRITLSAFRTGANPLAPPLAQVEFLKVVWAGTFIP